MQEHMAHASKTIWQQDVQERFQNFKKKLIICVAHWSYKTAGRYNTVITFLGKTHHPLGTARDFGVHWCDKCGNAVAFAVSREAAALRVVCIMVSDTVLAEINNR